MPFEYPYGAGVEVAGIGTTVAVDMMTAGLLVTATLAAETADVG